MSVSLQKGSSVSLKKAAEDAGSTLGNKLTAGAGWDGTTDQPIDLDLCAVLVGTDGKAIPDANGNGTNADEALLFFNNKELPGLHHSGDNRTGEGDGDDEQISVDLSAVPSNAQEVALFIASYSGENFGQVKNSFVRLVNADDNKELVKYDLTDNYGDTKAVELGRLVRNGDSWDFKATGESRTGDINAVIEGYGVTGVEA